MPLAPGSHAVYFDVPAGTFDGSTSTPVFVRVRLSSIGGLGETGLAPNGEVEDYRWNFGPTAVSLTDFSADTSGNLAWVITFAAATSLLAGVGVTITRRRRGLMK